MDQRISQIKNLVYHFRAFGCINSMVALKEYGIFRLAARINDLKNDGFVINSKLIKNYRTGKRYSNYTLVKEPKK